MSLRFIARLVLALIYAAAGLVHVYFPAPFLAITPGWVPLPDLVITLTGVAELAGAAGVVQPWSPALRRAAGWGLAAYALCVWPANFNHMLLDMADSAQDARLDYHIPRLAAQPLLIWLALWASEVTQWPFRRR